MKKSCSDKESKVVTTQGVENVLKGSKDQREHLTEEQLLINQKLQESGIEDEGLGWVEKRNIFKTINVSLDTAGSERLQRSSPRLSKLANSKPSKWIENSFEASKNEESHSENIPKGKQCCKKDSESNACKKLTPVHANKRKCPETEESTPKSHHKPKTGERLQRDGEAVPCDTPKSSRQVHYIKIEIEDNSKEECNSVSLGTSPGLGVGKKRTSNTERGVKEIPKKIKMEENSNGVFPEEEAPLKVELELEKRIQSAPFKIRDIKTIVSECEIRNKKWKETFLKYKCPTRWGIPIVKNCSQKWDGKQIPPKLLLRYQKYLSSKNLTHPIFLPVKSQSSVDLSKLGSEISSQSSTCGNGECKDESESDFNRLGEGSFAHGDSSCSGLENNLNAPTSPRDGSGRMVLRNRNQQKTIISDDDEFSSDDSDDWLAQQKSSMKQKFNARNKKGADQSNKQLVLKLEKCNINRGNGNERGRKNGNKNDGSFTGGAALSSSAPSQAGGNTKPGPDPDTMVCPICSLSFKKQHIESHATECASKTYKD